MQDVYLQQDESRDELTGAKGAVEFWQKAPLKLKAGFFWFFSRGSFRVE